MTDSIKTDRIPISDLGLEDQDVLHKYNAAIRSHSYSSAVSILDDNQCNKGIRASIFNEIKTRLLELEVFFLNLTADEDTLYALSEPDDAAMAGKKFWVKPYPEH